MEKITTKKGDCFEIEENEAGNGIILTCFSFGKNMQILPIISNQIEIINVVRN